MFVGGCTLEAAEAVCSPDAEGELGIDVVDGLAALVDKSLLRQEEGLDGEPRFMMLETIREYALERLAMSGEVEIIRQTARGSLAVGSSAARVALEEDGVQAEKWLEHLEARSMVTARSARLVAGTGRDRAGATAGGDTRRFLERAQSLE